MTVASLWQQRPKGSLTKWGRLAPLGGIISSDARPSPSRLDYVTIAAVSSAIMLYQIALTRVLSVVVWYHFAFLTISLVMLGLGVPGIWFADRKNPERLLPRFLLASGITTPLSIIVVLNCRTISELTGLPLMGIITVSVLPATLSLGGAVCLLLIKAPGAFVSKMYGADLAGAALGAVAVIPLMSTFPTPQLAAASGLLPLLCGVAYGGRLSKAAAAVALTVAATILQGGAYNVTVNKLTDESDRIRLAERWTPIARLTVFQEDSVLPFTWGAGSKVPDYDRSQLLWLEQDGSAGTPITHFTGDLGELEALQYDVTTVGYQVRSADRVAIIGGGGGRDILSALVNGATNVDAIELNSETIDLVSGEFGDFSGDIYHHPSVHAFASEGRSHLTHSDGGFDLIQISLIDSWAASSAGAFALAENNLYTIEAFRLYRAKLSARGVLATSRWKAELPRLVALGRAALEADGVDPVMHMMLVTTERAGTLLSFKDPFTEADVTAAHQACEKRGFQLVYPAPSQGPEPALRRLLVQGVGVLARAGLNVTPPTDDSPYFFHEVSPFKLSLSNKEGERLTGLDFNLQATKMLQLAMVLVCALAVFLFLLPFVTKSARRWDTTGEQLVRGSLYFATIGASFMLLENMLLQHFVLYLGHPSYATTVIIASLLIGMGLGSFSAERVGLARLQWAGLAVPAILAVGVLSLPTLFATTLGIPLAARILVACALLIPLGLILGLFFPLGMTRFGDAGKPWFWAVNGIFGVVASVMSLALSMEFGFGTVGLLAALGYLGAWWALRPSSVGVRGHQTSDVTSAVGPPRA